MIDYFANLIIIGDFQVICEANLTKIFVNLRTLIDRLRRQPRGFALHIHTNITLKMSLITYATIAAAAASSSVVYSPATPQTSAESDSTVYATNLRDVEVVGVKTVAPTDMELKVDIDRSQLERLNLQSVRAVSEIAPNFFMPQYGSRMTSSIYVRGLGARIDQPVVGLNVDNVPYLNKDNYDFGLADIQSVEVLRGSAGVLNGRNAMAGQINIRTLSPWDYRGVRASLEYSRANTVRANAGWYGLITDRLATAVTGQFGYTDGFYQNSLNQEHSGRERQGSLRWKLSWHPHTRWSLANTASLNLSHQDGYPYENIASGKIAYNDSTFYRRTSFTDGLTVSYTGKRMIATSITSVQYLNDNMTLDQDFLPDPYFTLTQKRREWSFTQDLFAKGTRGGYSWLIGVFGFAKKTKMNAPVTFKDTGIAKLIEGNVNSHLPAGMELRWDERQMLLGSDFSILDGGFALYHQSTYDFNSHFAVQAGLRWDIEHISFDYDSHCQTSATMGRIMPNGKWVPMAQRPIDIQNQGNLHQTFNELIPQLTLSYRQSPQFAVRASVAKGYKAGGYNTQMFSDILQQQLMTSMGGEATTDVEKILSYKPEKSWTYEVTFTAGNPTGRISGELTLFWLSCRDQQLTIFPEGNATGRAMTNAGRTRSLGIEATAHWRPTDAFTINGSYGFTHATFTNYNNGREDLKGKRLPYAPAHTLFIAADCTLPVTFAGFTPSVSLNTRGVGDIYWNDLNTERQHFYATLGASVNFSHERLTLSIWGENITNTRYSTFYFESIGNRFLQRANPWTLGATLRLTL